jgi:hypothetical protein
MKLSEAFPDYIHVRHFHFRTPVAERDGSFRLTF